jgi:hypothetical protein
MASAGKGNRQMMTATATNTAREQWFTNLVATFQIYAAGNRRFFRLQSLPIHYLGKRTAVLDVYEHSTTGERFPPSQHTHAVAKYAGILDPSTRVQTPEPLPRPNVRLEPDPRKAARRSMLDNVRCRMDFQFPTLNVDEYVVVNPTVGRGATPAPWEYHYPPSQDAVQEKRAVRWSDKQWSAFEKTNKLSKKKGYKPARQYIRRPDWNHPTRRVRPDLWKLKRTDTIHPGLDNPEQVAALHQWWEWDLQRQARKHLPEPVVVRPYVKSGMYVAKGKAQRARAKAKAKAAACSL